MHFLCPYLPASFFLLAASNTFQLLLAMIIKSFPINLGHKIILFLDFTPRNSMPRSLSVLLTIHFISFLLINYATVYTWALLKHCWWYLTRHLIHLQGDSSLVSLAFSSHILCFDVRLRYCPCVCLYVTSRKIGKWEIAIKRFSIIFLFYFQFQFFPTPTLFITCAHPNRIPLPTSAHAVSGISEWKKLSCFCCGG